MFTTTYNAAWTHATVLVISDTRGTFVHSVAQVKTSNGAILHDSIELKKPVKWLKSQATRYEQLYGLDALKFKRLYWRKEYDLTDKKLLLLGDKLHARGSRQLSYMIKVYARFNEEGKEQVIDRYGLNDEFWYPFFVIPNL